ncbi:MAG: GTPase HflX [Wenzhouxiangella sp.]|nr:GTPase HflX [Wenzhouxiangella sp.]MDR9453711.1 GTPase HflX [Wenzhouxiangella sp.]
MLLHPELGAPLSLEAKQEFQLLAKAAGLDVLAELGANRHRADPGTLVGSGKVDELAEALASHGAGLVLINATLTPVQERNLSRRLKCPVLDRTTLILDIFAQRARSHEGKLQVELAQQKHLATRLIRGWTHLERQRGGIGMRGPGETQLETDRRLVGERIRQLTQRLGRVERRRAQGRRSRQRAEVPMVALVGYTNAGKSTLFNRLTDADVLVKDQLFATLDSTVRRLQDPASGDILVSDTVGFVRDLPHELVAAFRSTLEETAQADLVLHVIDGADPDRLTYQAVVEEVLIEIGAGDVPVVKVINKADLADRAVGVEHDASGAVSAVVVSALAGEGLEALKEVAKAQLSQGRIQRDITVPLTGQRLRAKLFDLGAVRSERIQPDGGSVLSIELDQRDVQRLMRLGGSDGQMAEQLLLN